MLPRHLSENSRNRDFTFVPCISPLELAAQKGDLEEIKRIDPHYGNTPDSFQKTPRASALTLAVEAGNESIFMFFMNMYSEDVDQTHLLWCAVHCDRANLVELLIDSEKISNIKKEKELAHAAQYGHVKSLQVILEKFTCSREVLERALRETKDSRCIELLQKNLGRASFTNDE